MMLRERVTVYDAKKDLAFDKTLKVVRKEANHARGTFAFDPDDFREEAKGFTVAAYRLSQDGLLEYAQLATRLKETFQQQAA